MLKDRIDIVREKWAQGKIEANNPVVVLEAAVLLDAEWDDLLDGIWVVTAPKTIALERLMETRGLPQEEAEKRITAQDSRRGIGNLQDEISNGVVTGVIENKGTLADLEQALGIAMEDSKSWK